MKKGQTKQKKRITGVHAPEYPSAGSAEIVEDENESLQERLLRLEKELKEARMRAALYEEIINVAEKKFDIRIRKKAGAKQ